MVMKPTYEELQKQNLKLEKELEKMSEREKLLLTDKKKLRRLLDIVPYPLLVSNPDTNRVSYANSGFTDTFGWELAELNMGLMPFIPKDLTGPRIENIRKLHENGILKLHETKRETKDGRIMDVEIQAAFYPEADDEPATYIGIYRDITQEKKIARINETMLRISMALPKYAGLRDLMNFISKEVMDIIGSEGAIILLLDKERKEFFTLGSAYEDQNTQERIKEVRFPVDSIIANEVVNTGEPVVIHDASLNPELHEERDRKLGYKTENLLEVPLRSGDKIIGVLGAINKKEGRYEKTDMELLNMIASTVALSCKNSKVSYELKKAYEEVSSLSKAKDKVINHLSHELKTPVAIIKGSLHILWERIDALKEVRWQDNLERIQRNMDRLSEIEHEVDDIMQGREPRSYEMISMILDQCTDELVTLLAEEIGEGGVIERVRQKVEEIFGPKDIQPKKILLQDLVRERLKVLALEFSHREVDIKLIIKETSMIWIPQEIIEKVFDGLLKNAVENTPDEGLIEIHIREKDNEVELTIRDYGVGITEENQRRIFEGFFATQEIMNYSSKNHFDFNAGGRGADLLRIKIFSEQYDFKVQMTSSRCPCIPEDGSGCPGRISSCQYCKDNKKCHDSGGTSFAILFPIGV